MMNKQIIYNYEIGLLKQSIEDSQYFIKSEQKRTEFINQINDKIYGLKFDFDHNLYKPDHSIICNAILYEAKYYYNNTSEWNTNSLNIYWLKKANILMNELYAIESKLSIFSKKWLLTTNKRINVTKI